MRLAFPLVRRGMERNLRLDPASVEASRATVEALFARAGERLRDGRPFLCGATFTAADVAFASLAAPVLSPAAYGGPLPALERLPQAGRAAVERWRDTDAGRFVLRLYATERVATVPKAA